MCLRSSLRLLCKPPLFKYSTYQKFHTSLKKGPLPIELVQASLFMFLRSSLRLLCKLAPKERNQLFYAYSWALVKYSTSQKSQANFKKGLFNRERVQASLFRRISNWRPENVLPNHSTQKQSLKPIKNSHQSTLPIPSAVKSMRGSPEFEGILLFYVNSVLKSLLCALYPYKKYAGRVMKKISYKFHQAGALSIIVCGDSCRHNINTNFFKFQSTSILAIRSNRRQEISFSIPKCSL